MSLSSTASDLHVGHWSAAISLALVTHMALAATFLPRMAPTNIGALGLGQEGIEIGFGQQGELGLAAHTQVPHSTSILEAPLKPISKTPIEPQPTALKDTKAQPEIPTSSTPPLPSVPSALSDSEVVVKPTLSPLSTETINADDTIETDPKPSKAALNDHQKPTTANTTDSDTARDEATNVHSQQSQQKQGSGAGEQAQQGGQIGSVQSYYTRLAGHLARYKRYPLAARRAQEEGQARLLFELDRHGKVLHYQLTHSSGSQRLDQAVLEMLARAQPLPPFPTELLSPQLRIELPVNFALKR